MVVDILIKNEVELFIQRSLFYQLLHLILLKSIQLTYYVVHMVDHLYYDYDNDILL